MNQKPPNWNWDETSVPWHKLTKTARKKRFGRCHPLTGHRLVCPALTPAAHRSASADPSPQKSDAIPRPPERTPIAAPGDQTPPAHGKPPCSNAATPSATDRRRRRAYGPFGHRRGG